MAMPLRRVLSTGDLVEEALTTAVGSYSAEERRERIDKYRSKRNQRNFDKITYACRKTLADSRPRVKGRFARNSSDGAAAAAEFEVLPPTNNNVPEWWPAVQEALARQEQEAGLHLCDTADDDLLAAYLGVSSIDLYSPRGR
uniref:CCT domain-containing protein n=1 Tax=Oryza punctata TaxID=4537 RepID=A0A0E0MBF0_ORYPU